MENPDKILKENLDRVEVEHKLRKEVDQKIADLIEYCVSSLDMERFEAYLAVEDMFIRTMNQRKSMNESQEGRI